jgi:hypothetical protein
VLLAAAGRGKTPRALAAIACLSLGVPAAPAAAAEPLRLSPRTDWVLDYADERCSLHLGLGDGDQALNLRIDWFGPRSAHRFLLVGENVPNVNTATSDIQFRFTPDAEPREAMALNGEFRDLPAVSFAASFVPLGSGPDWERLSATERMQLSAMPKPAQPDFEKTVRSLEVRFANGTEIVLDLGSMAKPLEALRACMDNLVSVWGLDPAVQNSLARLAVPKPSTIRRVQRRYPTPRQSAGVNAFVPVRVMLDAAGEVTACVVQSEGIDEAFTDAVCDGLARGYEPARDAAGRPVASVYSTSVFYLTE